MRCIVMAPGAELSATGVSLTALTEHVHSDAAFLPGRTCFLLMWDLKQILTTSRTTWALPSDVRGGSTSAWFV